MKKFFIFAFIFALAFLVTKSLWSVQWYPMHDTTHIARASLMKDTIFSGQFPPIWADIVNERYGYPLFHFYAPLVYYLAILIKFFTPSFLLSFKFVLFLFAFIGGWGMYLLTKKWGLFVALLAVSSFLMLPYGAVSLYVRGAFAEYAAMMLLPWLFFVWRQPQRGRQVYLTAFVTTLFLLSHNLVPLIVFPVFLAWTLYYHYRDLKSLILPTLLSLSLSAYFLVPLFFERSFVQVDKIARTTDFHLHFVEPWQLWNSTWGYGGSALGVEDGMSFKIGKLQILLAIFGLLSLFKSKRFRSLGWLLFLSICFAFIMTTKFSLPIWQTFESLGVIQFPWRYLTLLSFLIAFLAGLSLRWLPKLFHLPSFLFLVLALLALNLKYFKPQTNLKITDDYFLNENYLTHTLAHIIPEYLPTWMPTFPSQPPTSFFQNNLEYRFKHTTNHYEVKLSLDENQTLVMNRAYYPTWKATLDNQTLPLTPTQTGLIQVNIPQGQHTLIIFQDHTLLEKLSFYLSLTASIFIIIKLSTKY